MGEKQNSEQTGLGSEEARSLAAPAIRAASLQTTKPTRYPKFSC